MKGILFRPEMITAIREDRKTVTRRLDHLKEINKEPDKWEYREKSTYGEFIFADSKRFITKFIKPRYHPGEVVYVKEAHYAYGHWRETGQLTLKGKPEWEFVREAGTIIHFADKKWTHALTKPSTKDAWYKRSPLFLEAEFARTFLKIVSVKPERLQEITEKDVIKEGIPAYTLARGCLATPRPDPRWAYIELWDSINAKPKKIITPTHHPIVILESSWAMNPWVWRIEFTPTERPAEEK